MRGKIHSLDKDQLELIELIDAWLWGSLTSNPKDYLQNEIIMETRTFLTILVERGWYREGSEEQDLLKELRRVWINDGGKWKAN